ncbi:hypothetical protein [Hymenobacter sp. GOD-10R]|uniref:hypothetical protein n=1 Tax=Hymenobacter sp. GOD-10R TaxID=3093922 RepID=UPI002D786184|nr:hypothetical protein [Hymenobacter sp. GOD-10R]WRQ27643.1 hypothetical protein SD425_21465 [Hymenobacter sp. GOD-10R]
MNVTHSTLPTASLPLPRVTSSGSDRLGIGASLVTGLASTTCSATPSKDSPVTGEEAAVAATPAAASECFIFNCTPSARPGEAISLQGSFGATAEVYLALGNSTSFQKLAPIQSADGKTKAQAAGSVLVEAPSGAGPETYRLYVQENGQKSPEVHVNRARGLFLDSPEIVPGEYLRIFGQNLQLVPGKARVRFAPKGGGKSLAGQINTVGSDDRKLICHTPAGLAHGVEYELFVSNGLGGSTAETKVEQTVKTLPAGVDYFHLGVGWAPGKYKTNVYNAKTNPDKPARGDGKANDLDAINDSIQKVWKMGGGIVRLPAGTYKLSFTGFGLHLHSGVVLMGDGKDHTKILVEGNASSNPTQQSWTFLLVDSPSTDGPCRRGGICNLTYENRSTPRDTNPYYNLVGKGVEFFLKGCRFTLNESPWLELADHEKLAIVSNEFTQGINFAAGIHGPLRLDGTKHWLVRGNTVNYAVDGISINNADRGVFEQNTVCRLGGIKYPTERNGKPIQVVNHVLAMNFTRNAVVLGNTFKVKNWPTVNINDGETIISEGIGYQRHEQDTGTATGGTATTLQDTTKSWKTTGPPHQVVAIVYGRGAGQCRTIRSRTATELTVDRAWDLAPDATSRYSILNWSAERWLVQSNTMEGNRRGITLYQGAIHQVAIVNNKLTNNGAIDFTPIQQGEEKMEFNPAWNNEVVQNTVNVANDPSNGGFIGVHAVLHALDKAFGIAVLDFVMRHNTLVARTPNVQTVVDANYPNGLFAYYEWHPGPKTFVDEGIPAVLGTILEDNTIQNADKDVYLSAGSYQTLVRQPAKASSAKTAAAGASLRSASVPAKAAATDLVHEDIFTNAVGHGSVRTIIL